MKLDMAYVLNCAIVLEDVFDAQKNYAWILLQYISISFDIL